MSRFPLALLFILSASPGCECVSDTVWTMWQSACTEVTNLGENAHSFLVSLIGKESVNTIVTGIRDGVKMMSEATASALNVAAGYMTELLTAAGVDFDLPVRRITPEGVAFVAQWALLTLIGYWLVSMTISILMGVLRRTLFLLKLGVAVSAFVWILSDSESSPETTGVRLSVLVLVCVLMGVGPSCFRPNASSHLEEKVKKLERRLAQVETERR